MELIQEAPIFKLNHDCLCKIFCYLNYAEKLKIDSTCRYFRNLDNWVIGLRDLNYLDVWWEQNDWKLTDQDVAIILRRNVHCLEFLQLPVSADKGRLKALRGCSSLEELHLWFLLKDYTPEQMYLISQVWEGDQLPNLKTLKLDNLPSNAWVFCRTIPRHVEEICLEGFRMLETRLNFQFERFTKLKKLELQRFVLSLDDLPGLETLSLESLKIISCSVKGDFVTRIIRMPTVKKLTLDTAWDMDTENFEELGKNDQIESLKLRCVRLGLKEGWLREICNMKNLKRLRIMQTQIFGAHLLKDLVHLQEFSASECFGITTEIVIALVTNARKLKRLAVYDFYNDCDFIRALSQILEEQPGRTLTFEIHEDLEVWVENIRLHPSLRFIFIP